METTDQMIRDQANTGTRHKEGELTKAIEDQTAKIPSDVFLYTSLGAMSVSLILKIMGKSHLSLFIGQWAAPFLLFGIYNKLVKQQGHDKVDKGEEPSLQGLA
ncbi:MAG TPA: hypothetical protein VGK59_06130 [Ohtaekwangia sp.]